MADAAGRSQSHEVERRLDRSFEFEESISQGLSLAYGRRVAGIAQLLATAMVHAGIDALLVKGGGPLAEHIDFTRWMDDPDAYEQAMRGVAAVLERFRPDGEVSNPHGASGKHMAEKIIEALAGRPPDDDGYVAMPLFSWDPADINRLLGALAARPAKARPRAERCPMCDQSLAPDKGDDSQT